MVLLVLMGVLSALAWRAENPPEPTADPQQFSALRAMDQLRFVLGRQRPHPTGTAENAAVRQRIVAAFEGLGYRPEEESSYTCDGYGSCAQVHNLVVPLPGTLDGQGVLLDAHYDSVGAGPGASDNASNVAVALEIARLLKGRTQPRRSVYMLIDDAEEQGLLGSQAFVEHSPFAARIGWAVNLDTRGVRGPSLMFETSQNNRALMRLYQKAVRKPVANSLMYSLYQRLPSETDFTNLRRHGIQGFNLAFLGGTGFYHRAGDSLAHLDARSMQHQGEEAFALVEALATNPLPAAAPPGDTVYFDSFGWMVEWSRWLTLFLVAVSVGLLLIAAVARRQFVMELRSVGWGAATPAIVVLVAGLVSFGLVRTLALGALLPPQFLAHPEGPLVAVSALGLAITAGVISLLPARVRPWEFLIGQWWIACGLAGGVSVFLFGGSYLLVAPCLMATAALALVSLCRLNKAEIAPSVALVSAIVPAVLWIPLFRLLYQGVGLLALPVIACVVAVECCLLLMPLFGSRRHLRSISAIAAGVALFAGITGILEPRYSVAAPLPFNIFYIRGADGLSQWLFGVEKTDVPLVSSLLQTAPFSVTSHPEQILPWLAGFAAPIYVAPAPILPIALPAMSIRDQQTTATEVCTQGIVTAPPEETRIVLVFPSGSMVRSIKLAGQYLASRTPETVAGSGGWNRYTMTNRPEGTEVSFCLAGGGAHDLYVVGETYGLPEQGAALLNARPKVASASQDGDLSIFLQHIRLTAVGTSR